MVAVTGAGRTAQQARYFPVSVWCALLLFLSLLCVSPLRAAQSDFPVPESIRPAIGFWIKVYTEADTQSGFLHDSRNLAIVYTKLKRDRSLIEETRKRIVADLQVLAGGKREGLSEQQQTLLQLWGEDTPDARFEQASHNVRWQLGQSDRYRAGLMRSGAYRSYIEQVVQEKGLPPELAALPHVESSFHPGAYSSAAASGMWQFVRETAQRFMQVDLVVDERLDPYIATNAAMELLKFNYDALGTWPLALTAYNHGTNGMARAVRDTGTRDIGRIISNYKGPRFGFASRNFYPQFLAALEVEKHAEQYFGPVTFDLAPEFSSVELKSFIDAAVVANQLGVDVDTLRRYNPALLPAVWSGNKRIPRGFRLKIDRNAFPGNLGTAISAIALESLFNEQVPDVSYKVQRGDTLSVIASRFDTSIAELVAINQLPNRHRIRIGQTLVLPQKNGVIPTLVVNDERQQIPQNGKYEVRRGDTISTIAGRFELDVNTLLALNGLDRNGAIYPGQELNLKPVPGAPVRNLEQVAVVAEAPEPAAEPEPAESGLTETQPTTPQQQNPRRELGPPVPASSLEIALDETEAQFSDEDSMESETDESAAELPNQLAEAPAVEDDVETLAVARAEENEVVLATDPGNFEVGSSNTIEILAEETLGHYADWLGIRASDLRRLNGIKYGAPVKVGDQLRLDFSKVGVEDFELRRKQYHSELQARYFADWRIRDTEQYSIKRRDFLMNLAQQRSVPMWLFRQYNPEVDADRLQIGQEIVFPVVEPIPN